MSGTASLLRHKLVAFHGRTWWQTPTMQRKEQLVQLLEEIDPRTLGLRITEARKARGKTQEEVASHLGLSRPTYIAIEKGERQVKPDEVNKLAKFLGRH